MNENKPSKVLIFGGVFFACCFGLIIYATIKDGGTTANDKSSKVKKQATTIVTENKETESTNDNSDSDKPKTSVTMTGHHLTQDYSGDTILVVEYDFYNGENEAKSFAWTFTDQCFQNGIECNDTVLTVDEIDAHKQIADILPETTLHFAVGYKLEDLSDVTIIVSEYITNEECIKETFSPQS